MNQPTKYDPPEAVVAPAFRELFDRLRRAQMTHMRKRQITDDERKAYEYGVAERQKVLGHSLFLVFAQWAIYRQAINRIKSRAIRLTYAMGSVVATTWFVQRRAAKVSKDTFAHIITTNMDSALGNEARIVLAELEGPEGPYLRQVYRERDVTMDFTSIALDDEQHDLHPQLRLKPRLLTEIPPHPPLPVIRRERPERATRSSSSNTDWRAMQPQVSGSRRTKEQNQTERQRAINHTRSKTMTKESDYLDPLEERTANAVSSNDFFTNREQLERIEKNERARERRMNGADSDQDNLWGKPFDFSEAAREGGEHVDLDPYATDNFDPSGDDGKSLTPSQRRAAERRLRRMRAEARSQQTRDHE